MALFDRDQRKIILRVVYDGAERAGKTTNVAQLYSSFTSRRRSEIFTPETVEGRTLYFDLMQLEAGLIAGYSIRCQLITVPGQSSLSRRRWQLLKSADTVVFVCESTPLGVEQARPMFSIVREYLHSLKDTTVPLVLQANKQDLEGSMDPAAVAAALEFGPTGLVVGARASSGVGVRETVMLAIRSAANVAERVVLARGIDSLAGITETGEALYRSMVESEAPRARVDVDAERLEREAAERAEAERLEREAAERAEVERLEREAAERAEAERLEREAAERAEAERLEREAAERAEAERLEREAAERAEAERLEREAAERVEAERLEREAAKRVEAERLEREAAERAEAERLEREAAERVEAERLEREAEATIQPKEKAQHPLGARIEVTLEATGVEPPMPRHDVGIGFIWPAATGREILRKVFASAVPVRRDDIVALQCNRQGWTSSDAILYQAGGWGMRTSLRRRFVDPDEGRAALLRLARKKMQLGRLLSPQAALSIQPEEGGAVWLWSITPWLPTLEEQLEEARRAGDAAAVESGLASYAAAAAIALSLAAKQRIVLDVHPNNFARVEEDLFYLDDNIGQGPRVASIGEAILRRCEEYSAFPSAVEGFITTFVAHLDRALPRPLIDELGVEESFKLASERSLAANDAYTLFARSFGSSL